VETKKYVFEVSEETCQGLPVFFFEATPDGLITHGRSHFARVLSLDGAPYPTHLHAFSSESFQAAWRRVLTGEAVHSVSIPIEGCTPADSPAAFSMSLFPILDAGRKLRAVRGSFTRLDPSTELDYALESSEERFRIVYQQCSDPVIILNLTCDILSANPALETLTGIPEFSFFQDEKGWSDLIHPDELGALFNAFEHCAAFDVEQVVECRLQTVTGDLWHEIRINIIHRETRAPRGFICVARDIQGLKTVQKERTGEAEQLSLKRLQARNLIAQVKSLISEISQLPRDSSPFIRGICRILNRQYGGCIISINMRRPDDKAQAEVTGIGFVTSTMHHELLNLAGPLYFNNLSSHALYAKDMVVQEWAMESFLGAPLQDSTGVTRGSLFLLSPQANRFTVEDIEVITITALLVAGRLRGEEQEADKRELESHLRQSQKMEAVGKMAGGIAHDFNNILSGILGFSSYLVSRAEPESSLYNDLYMIQKSAERATDLTRQLLVFARKRHFEKCPVSINKVIAESTGILTHSISKRVDIETHLTPNLPPVLGDEGQMIQVFMNICLNAADAIGKEYGFVDIKTETRELTNRENQLLGHPRKPPAGWIVVTVEDNGSGMSPDVLEHLFEPFFTTKPEQEGTGLGMSIVYGIIQNHHGEILVDSSEEKGTTFSIFLPGCFGIIESEDQDHKALRGTETLLVIDDELIIRRMAVETLSSYGYTVYAAASAEEAMKRFDKLTGVIDLVILDLALPKTDGPALFRKLSRTFNDKRFLIMSGYATEDRFREFLQVARPELLEKPFKSDELARKVRHVLDQLDPA
jgi:PAS domain S-box-containing protein